jgi:hypothetical protein
VVVIIVLIFVVIAVACGVLLGLVKSLNCSLNEEIHLRRAGDKAMQDQIDFLTGDLELLKQTLEETIKRQINHGNTLDRTSKTVGVLVERSTRANHERARVKR